MSPRDILRSASAAAWKRLRTLPKIAKSRGGGRGGTVVIDLDHPIESVDVLKDFEAHGAGGGKECRLIYVDDQYVGGRGETGSETFNINGEPSFGGSGNTHACAVTDREKPSQATLRPTIPPVTVSEDWKQVHIEDWPGPQRSDRGKE